MKESTVTQANQLSELKQVNLNLMEQTKAPFILSHVDLDAISEELTKSKKYVTCDLG